MDIKLQKLNPNALIPTKGSALAAGYDLYACLEEDVTIEPGETKLIGTGIAITALPGTFGAIFARSGLATKQGLRPANCVGVIDQDYTGEIMVALHNDSAEARVITNEERIAQLIFVPYENGQFIEVVSLETTDRGNGGFGSTGE